MSCFSRRKFLVCGLAAPSVALLAATARGECVDPDELSDAVQGMRDSLSYTDTSSEPQRACTGCTYFKPAKPTDACGHCEVLGGPVSSKGHCDSWTKRS